MKTEIHTLNALADHYRSMVQNCTDAIKFLSGDIPKGFKINFSIDRIPVVAFDIGQEDETFCLGLFMSWHEYYARKLGEVQTQLAASELVGSTV